MRRAGTVAVALAATCSLMVAASAGGAVGALTYEGCHSGEEDTLFLHCDLIPTSAAGGDGSGLNGAESVTVSRDGRWVYVVARQDDSIARFKRTGEGALDYRGCVSGDSDAACTALPEAVSGGGGSGLDDVRVLVISRDGRWAYAVAGNDDSIARFRRDTGNGLLKLKDCVTGATESGPTGSGACAELPTAAALGADSGLDHPKSLVLSGDGTSLYVAATNDAAITRFKRDTRNGRLTFKDCITGETETGAPGSAACAMIPGAQSQGDDSGLDDPRGLGLARRGRALLGVSSDDDALFTFDRDEGNGRITFDGCLTGETETIEANSGCGGLGDTAQGADSGLDDARSLALSRDGNSVYLISRFDSSIYHFPVGEGGSFPECYSADIEAAGGAPCLSIGTPSAFGQGTGFASPESVVVSRDGRSVYVSSANDDAVTRFRRDRATGALTHKGCITGEEESGSGGTLACEEIATTSSNGTDSGLDFPQFMALSPDDESLYLAAGQDDAVAMFQRQP